MTKDPIYTYKMFDIGGIPAVVTEDHHEVFPFWVTSGIRNATLFHIDEHDDMKDSVKAAKFPIHSKTTLTQELVDYTRSLGIANFICPAFNYNIFNSAYWYNPWDDEIKDLGEVDGEKRNNLKTFKSMQPGIEIIHFEQPYHNMMKSRRIKEPIVIQKEDLVFNTNTILDIDLDAFLMENFELDKAYEQRLKHTKEMLTYLPRPQLITITRSQGSTITGNSCNIPFVPPIHVNKVQKGCIAILQQTYA